MPNRSTKETVTPAQPRLHGVRYRKTASGWLEPMVQAPGWRLPPKTKTALDVLVRLTKLGATIEEAGADGWARYTTTQGTTGKVRVLP